MLRVGDWDSYLQSFHAERPGITERAFHHATHQDVGSPYAWLVAALPPRLGDVLDVACGNAALLPWLTGHDSYLGVDLSHSEVAHARRTGRGPVTMADARRLPMPDSSVDTVVSSMGLMLVRPVEAAVAEIRRVLRPGGTLALLVPAVWPVRLSDVALGLPLTIVLRGPGSMPQQLSPRRLRRVLTENGLRPQEVERRRFPFPVHSDEHAALAVRALYTPGRSARQLALAESLLARYSRPAAELPVPLARVVATA
jgi:SAM-dependent methyltransferase